MQSVSAVLDAQKLTSKTPEITITNETIYTIYVFGAGSGTHNNHEVAIQASPDGAKWKSLGSRVTGLGYATESHAATIIRGRVVKKETGPLSEIEVHLVAI